SGSTLPGHPASARSPNDRFCGLHGRSLAIFVGAGGPRRARYEDDFAALGMVSGWERRERTG
ncbi:hypothetical protein ACFL5O_11790, partial [Myxococcota bacterium]